MAQNNNNNMNYIPLVPFMPQNPLVGYGYVPYQINPEYFSSVQEAYKNGTIFPELTTPYLNHKMSREV